MLCMQLAVNSPETAKTCLEERGIATNFTKVPQSAQRIPVDIMSTCLNHSNQQLVLYLVFHPWLPKTELLKYDKYDKYVVSQFM